MAYTYLVGWSKLDLWYYGVRFAKDCHPSDLWVKYFTSSDVVKALRKSEGEPDVIEVRRTFNCIIAARSWEYRVLRRTCAKRSLKWLNMTDSRAIFITDPERRREISAMGARALAAKLANMPDDERKARMAFMASKRAESIAKRTPEQLAASTLKRKVGYALKSADVKDSFVSKCKQIHLELWGNRDFETRENHRRAVTDGHARNKAAMTDTERDKRFANSSSTIKEGKAKVKAGLTADELDARSKKSSAARVLSWETRRRNKLLTG